MEVGIDGLIDRVKSHEIDGISEEKKDFYNSCSLALKGVSEYALRYAALAKVVAAKMTGGSQESDGRSRRVVHDGFPWSWIAARSAAILGPNQATCRLPEKILKMSCDRYLETFRPWREAASYRCGSHTM